MTTTTALPSAVPVASRWRRVRGPVVVAGVVGVVGLGLLLRDPHGPGSWGFCLLHWATGWYCVTCGGLRASADLLQGDWAGAWAMNPLWTAAAPLLVVWWVFWLVAAWRGRRLALPSTSVWVTGLVGLVVFMVLRNLPWFSTLAPG